MSALREHARNTVLAMTASDSLIQPSRLFAYVVAATVVVVVRVADRLAACEGASSSRRRRPRLLLSRRRRSPPSFRPASAVAFSPPSSSP